VPGHWHGRQPLARGAEEGEMASKLRFRCASCQRGLSAPAAMAGKQARCPDCGTMQHVPTDASGDAAASGVATEAPVRAAPSAFAARETAAEGEFRYEAFISYRHVEPDRTWAKWLHTALETYRVPAKLAADRGLPRRIGRVFRDEEELPASADLNAEIESALKDSRFLVVICSPRTPESEWVNRSCGSGRWAGTTRSSRY